MPEKNSQHQINLMYKHFIDLRDPEMAIQEWARREYGMMFKQYIESAPWDYQDMISFAKFYAERIR